MKDYQVHPTHRLIYAQVGHTVVAWLWLREAAAAQRALPSATGADVPFYEGKIATARYFFRHELVVESVDMRVPVRVDGIPIDLGLGLLDEFARGQRLDADLLMVRIPWVVLVSYSLFVLTMYCHSCRCSV